MMTPKMSIIVPVYNVEKYLSQCLDSLVNQSLKEIEIILVNDGSTDNSETICHIYSEKDSRVKVYSKPNGGLSDARNYGLKCVTSKVVGFVDSDDYVDLDMFQTLFELKEKTLSDIAVGGVKMVTDEGDVYQTRSIEADATFAKHDAMKELLKSKRITNSVCNKIFDLSLFEQVSFPVGKLYEDEYVTYKLFDCASIVSMTNQTYYYYRSNPNSITHMPFSEREFDRIYASQEKVAFISNHYPDLVPLVQQYLVYDCVMALSKMAKYKKDYNSLTRDNIRQHLFCFLRSDYSIGTKIFAALSSLSPKFTIRLYKAVISIVK